MSSGSEYVPQPGSQLRKYLLYEMVLFISEGAPARVLSRKMRTGMTLIPLISCTSLRLLVPSKVLRSRCFNRVGSTAPGS